MAFLKYCFKVIVQHFETEFGRLKLFYEIN